MEGNCWECRYDPIFPVLFPFVLLRCTLLWSPSKALLIRFAPIKFAKSRKALHLNFDSQVLFPNFTALCIDLATFVSRKQTPQAS